MTVGVESQEIPKALDGNDGTGDFILLLGPLTGKTFSETPMHISSAWTEVSGHRGDIF
jgi:hypothetical protein